MDVRERTRLKTNLHHLVLQTVWPVPTAPGPNQSQKDSLAGIKRAHYCEGLHESQILDDLDPDPLR